MAERDDAGARERDDLRRYLRHVAIAQRDRFYADPTGPGAERVDRALAGLRDLAAERGLALDLVIFPNQDQLEAPPADGPPPPQRFWAERCRAFELRCIDLLSQFTRWRADGPLFDDLQHPNARGLERAAEATAERLLR